MIITVSTLVYLVHLATMNGSISSLELGLRHGFPGMVGVFHGFCPLRRFATCQVGAPLRLRRKKFGVHW